MMCEKIKNNKFWKVGFWLTLLAFLSLVVFFVSFYIRHEYCHSKYDFTLGECVDLVIDKKAYLETKVELEEYFAEKKAEGKIADVSVYFRDLNRGPVMGINETELFSSASLLKLPMAMSVLRMAEERPEILDINLINAGDDLSPLQQYYIPEKKIITNQSYSVRDLIYYALVYSDNTALRMLDEFMYIEGSEVNRIDLTLKELGLVLPDEVEDRDISTRAYASLFRLLYNSSYLEHDFSEMVLSYLSESGFKEGMRKKIPSDVKVAHKFGERYYGDIKQLHDCGVVYYPENPYLLCVMTLGKDFDDLAEVISHVSDVVYREVDSRKLD